jgi:hypothetical protein
MDELTKLYLRVRGQLYRIKVFETTVGIERQPGGQNHIISRDDYPVYDEAIMAWDYEVLTRLIENYQFAFANGRDE